MVSMAQTVRGSAKKVTPFVARHSEKYASRTSAGN
jgi:hypothetical protein